MSSTFWKKQMKSNRPTSRTESRLGIQNWPEMSKIITFLTRWLVIDTNHIEWVLFGNRMSSTFWKQALDKNRTASCSDIWLSLQKWPIDRNHIKWIIFGNCMTSAVHKKCPKTILVSRLQPQPLGQLHSNFVHTFLRVLFTPPLG